MNKQDVKDFFDAIAKEWDEGLDPIQYKIDRIFKYAHIYDGCTVLDVACGTGVLVPQYLRYNVGEIVGIDISTNMINVACEKFADNDKVKFICDDIETWDGEMLSFDRCMIFNAFPHFVEPAKVIENIYNKLKMNGRITIAHDMGREQLDRHHSGVAKKVSNGLISEDEMEQLLSGWFDVDVKISEKDIYIVSGTKNN